MYSNGAALDIGIITHGRHGECGIEVVRLPPIPAGQAETNTMGGKKEGSKKRGECMCVCGGGVGGRRLGWEYEKHAPAS